MVYFNFNHCPKLIYDDNYINKKRPIDTIIPNNTWQPKNSEKK